MLVLTRRVGERLLIGSDIEVTVLEVKGENIRIGIDAPREMRIQRAEAVQAVGAENTAAATASAHDPAAAEAALRALLQARGRNS